MKARDASHTAQVKTKELKAAAKISLPPSEATRKLCAARLMTVLEKAGKAPKKPEASKTEPSNPAQTLPGPPTQNDVHPANGGSTAAAETGATRQNGSKADQTKQHERRGENALLKETLEHLQNLHSSKVGFPTWAS